MFTFFWKHKFISLLIICVVAYIFVNPPHKFGLAWKSFVIFNRIPITYMDIYIPFNGSLKPLAKISDIEARKDWMSDLMKTPHEEELELIVGTGFGRPSFQLEDTAIISLETKGIHCTQLLSPQAMKLYNSMTDQNKKVAILLSIQR
jgi:hypothetical protein